jgi:hypothetical protein
VKRPPWLRWPRRKARIYQSWFETIAQRAADMDSYFSFGGVGYSPVGGQVAPRNQERMEGDFAGLVRDALKGNAVIWACERLRVAVFSEARFLFQHMNDGRPGDLHDSVATRLELLEHPWDNAVTGDLLARVRLMADFAGNAYIVRRTGLRILRPDWVSIILGSDDEEIGDPNDVDAQIIAYAYWPGGWQSGKDPDIFLPDEVAHFAPMPDPIAHYRGMSWLNPVIAELETDQAATTHTMQFFRNGATTQVIVNVDKDMEETAFERFMKKFNGQTKGLENAYKTIYVTGGIDATVVGTNLADLDLKGLHGSLETRIAAAAGTPPILVGLSEGLNAGQYNIYGQAKRAYVDGCVRPDWRNLCGSLETIVAPPNGSRLWYDDRDIAYLREDQIDQAQIVREQMAAIQMGLNSGFEPDAVVEAVVAGDLKLLIGHHTGLFSVQLQPPSSGTMNDPTAVVPGPVGPPPPRSDVNNNGKRPALAGARAGGQ